jgi:malonyl CoA-acyl carrier protein transacylase
MSLAFLFPGQGSQSVGMGAGLFERFPEVLQHADEHLGYSLSSLCLEDPDGKLGRTEFTQPALYVVSYLHARSLVEDGTPPSFAAGHSVGEFAALASSGAIEFSDGLRMVAKRGEIMSGVTGGGMAAVIGLDADVIRETLSTLPAPDIDLANFNSPGQIVVSGPAGQINRILAPLKEAGAKLVVPLKVSGAFHSRMMEGAALQFKEFLKSFSFSQPKIPIYSNVEAVPYADAESIPSLLVRQIHSPVRWTETITRMRSDGVLEFEECGPGNVLNKLLRQIP